MVPYTAPSLNGNSFNCPHCNAYANQIWFYLVGSGNGGYNPPSFLMAKCTHCLKPSMWYKEQMFYPNVATAPLPNPDMPEDVLQDYNEARLIADYSPKGAAALLRLAIQKLCIHLGEEGHNINADIASLVKKGLPERLQRALDSVRVVGNNAVHPGQISLDDDPELTFRMFHFINLIVDVMITQPKQIDEVYNLKLPESAREAIERRDKKA